MPNNDTGLIGLAERHLHILQHSLGVDQFGRGKQYRNHFATGSGSVDHPDCMALVEHGLMTRRTAPEHFGGMDFFFVTDAGRKFVAEKSPAPPKLTRGQMRYRQWLDGPADSMSFGDFLHARHAARPGGEDE